MGDKVDDLLKKLETAVDSAAGTARRELNVAEGAVNRTAAQVENAAKNSLKGLQQSFQQEIDALKAKAKKAGVNADECFGKDEKTLVNLPTAATSDMIRCVQGYVNRIFGDANQALNKVSEDIL